MRKLTLHAAIFVALLVVFGAGSFALADLANGTSLEKLFTPPERKYAGVALSRNGSTLAATAGEYVPLWEGLERTYREVRDFELMRLDVNLLMKRTAPRRSSPNGVNGARP